MPENKENSEGNLKESSDSSQDTSKPSEGNNSNK